ncbi:hypothetical protein BAUCODRAFT_299499 [Baudoinia panamericana UAMH 10762]|uniref:CTLH domain-containing protein n=1 Tax=Baudoinia panamericana (strain UAMH 10762) TaxID=717646 RepID=M2MY93_BAUPA|nr:uncharacterized protein BAUCODRAFT_299499 [Baudoinia panamericana UAMH 10762]EMC91629.1 hypothetical protein BAUCODRAFT_299499 [Baudoinia panamericana UAMH 10762]
MSILSSTGPAASTMRGSHSFDRKVEEMKPSKSDINWVIMDYLVSEGYPGAAEKFAQETNMASPVDNESIRERVRIRNAIHGGRIDEAIEMINEIDPEILDTNPLLHFHLLQLHLIEIIRAILSAPSGANPIATDFLPAIKFATEQLSPRAPTDPTYQQALERTMALMIFPPEKMTPEFKELLDVRLREKVAGEVNKAVLESRGQRSEAKIRQLIRARAWAEGEARAAKVELPAFVPVGLDAEDVSGGVGGGDGDAMVH